MPHNTLLISLLISLYINFVISKFSNEGIITYCHENYFKLFSCDAKILPSNYVIVDKNCFLAVLNFEKSMYFINSDLVYVIHYLFIEDIEKVDNYYLKTDAVFNYSSVSDFNYSLLYPINKKKLIPYYVNRFDCSDYNFQIYDKSLYTETCEVYMI